MFLKWNVATVDECIKLVNEKRIANPSLGINGMTYMSQGSKTCYAEINDNRIGPWGCTRNCQTCIFKGKKILLDITFNYKHEMRANMK